MGESQLRRYTEGANIAARPLPTAASLINGDRFYARAEGILSILVGPIGARSWFEISAGAGLGTFGDGSDGDVVIAAPTTLTRDMYFNSLKVSAPLFTNGFRVYSRESIQVDAVATVSDDGNPGALAVPGAATTTGTLHAGSSGGAGSVGAGVGTVGATDASTGMVTPVGGDGGNGGAGGVNAGGLGGVHTVSATEGSLHTQAAALACFDRGPVLAGAGGGGGGSDAAAVNGGGGGGGGGVVFMASPRITAAGTISARGGAGGHAAGGPGNGGGGGGGGGGDVILVGLAITITGGFTVGGGAGGAPVGAGGAGLNGIDGTVDVIVLG